MSSKSGFPTSQSREIAEDRNTLGFAVWLVDRARSTKQQPSNLRSALRAQIDPNSPHYDLTLVRDVDLATELPRATYKCHPLIAPREDSFVYPTGIDD